MAIPNSLQSTKVFDTFWSFAVSRQHLFFKRIQNPRAQLWTDDPILARHKFTNAYRVSDRVSQYLVRNVIYSGDMSPNEVFFRIILFKLFNKIETWELLKRSFGELTWKEYSFKKFDSILSKAKEEKKTIYSAAYIMASGRSSFGNAIKHRNHLRLIEKMMSDELPTKVENASNMQEVFNLFLEQPAIGNFLAFQYSIDINYSPLTEFSENDFVVPGPGSIRGIEKCFSDFGKMSASDIIRHVTDNQQREFEKRGLEFNSLWGRPLHLIDIQNLFCEVDKYSRIFHPDIASKDGRKRIKQIFRPNREPIEYFFPPKWGLNQQVQLGLNGRHDSFV